MTGFQDLLKFSINVQWLYNAFFFLFLKFPSLPFFYFNIYDFPLPTFSWPALVFR